MRLVILLICTAVLHAADTASIFGIFSAKEKPGLAPDVVMRVDGKKVARLAYPTYYRLDVPPGVYNVTIGDLPSPSIICHVVAAESCYVKASVTGGKQQLRVDLLTHSEAAPEFRKVRPLDQEKVFMRSWK